MMWEYSDNEYIKVFRKMLNWEWYTDVNTTKLFLHCLLKANWRDTKWRGIDLKRGQFVTSLPSLSKETGLSLREVRTALNHLQATGEVTGKIYPKFRVITVNSYDEFQRSDRQNGSQMTGKRQAIDRQATPDIINKELLNKEKKRNRPGGQEVEPEHSWLDDTEGEWV